MNVSVEFLERAAAETGFQAATLEKVVRLGELAGAVGAHPLLRSALALKGGTALQLFFGPPRRLSVDLDFNYVEAADRETMMERRPVIERALFELSSRLGFRVQQSREEHAGRKLHLRYGSALGGFERIQLDINYLFRTPLPGAERREMWQPSELDRPSLLVVSIEELAIGKLLALLDRTTPRDIYDTAHLPSIARTTLETPRFRSLFVSLATTLKRPLYEYDARRLETVTDQALEEQLFSMLISDERPSAAQLRRDAAAVIEPLLSLSEPEQELVRRVERGELALDLLFAKGDPDRASLERHPALLWKLQNVRQHLAKKSGG